MKPLFLSLISTQAFVSERCELLLTAKRIGLFYTKLLGIDARVNPSESLSGPMYFPCSLLEFLILPLQHSLLLYAIGEVLMEILPVGLQVSNLLLF